MQNKKETASQKYSRNREQESKLLVIVVIRLSCSPLRERNEKEFATFQGHESSQDLLQSTILTSLRIMVQ